MKPGHDQFSRTVEEQAAEWAARLDGGSLPPAERQAFVAWLAQDSTHGMCLEGYQQLSNNLDVALPELAKAGAVFVPDTLSRPAWRWQWATGLAAAATVAVLLWVSSGDRPRAATTAALPLTYTTQAAERLTRVLVDGSRADLNAQTSLIVDMGKSSRHVRLLRGEAMFSVAKDPARPFIVETPAGSMRVTGTVFNVRADTPAQLEVTVLEGTVRVEPHVPPLDTPRAAEARAPLSLTAGQQLTLDAAAAHVRMLPATTMKDVVSWRQGPVAFDGVPLREALQLVACFQGCTIAASPEVANLRLGGRYSLDDLDEFLSALEKALPVRVVRRDDGSMQVSAR